MSSSAPDDLAAAGREAGSTVEIHVCKTAGHAESPEACAGEYAGWVLGFLERVLVPAG
jgi:hypothetical protein